ncbi:MAG: site-specific DNA-methyltransferase, partial [Bdellovibrionales bacterium]|nr:site-specific DNA-methyltransferase [Bdellovibrionales bacterium]
MGQKLKFNLEKNSIVCGDCCNEEGNGWLNFIPDNSVDLIYIDPPFFSNKNYEIVWGNGFEVRSFGDRWKGGIEHYIDWMKPKLEQAKRVLKDTGVIVFHCDKNASHKIRCLLDDRFGGNNFVNEIIWYYRKWTNSPNIFQQNHDNIYIYKKDKPYIFNPKYQDAKDVRDWKLNTVKDNGKRINQIIIYDEQKTEKAFKEGRIKFKKEDLRVVHRKKNEVAMDDVWDLGVLSSNSPERIGYKTQKPERLICRFIECFSNEQSIVLDFFGGGGTTAKVCSDLNR